MTQEPGTTPPTQSAPPSDDATRVRTSRTGPARTQQLDPPVDPPARGHLRFYSGVACASLLLALVIGVGGFLGIRGLGDGPAAPPAASDTGEGEGGAGTPEIPTGAQHAQPQGTAVPVDISGAEGYLEVTFGQVSWNADAAIAEANMFNDPPAEGHRYLMVTLEARYRGSGSFTAYAWARLEYVAPDGTVHSEQRIATPNHVSGGHGQIRDGQDFLEETVFEVPADIAEGGHFVIAGNSVPTEEGTWVDAV